MCDSGSVVRRRDWHRNHRMYLWIRSGNRHVSPENPREDIRLAGKWESGLKVSGSLNVPKNNRGQEPDFTFLWGLVLLLSREDLQKAVKSAPDVMPIAVSFY